MRERKVEELFLRYRERGDVAALGEAFDAVSPELFRLARHLVHDAADAEDAVQTAFLVAVEKPEQYDATRPFVPWLVGILVRRAHELRRARARRPELERLQQRAVREPHAELEARELHTLLERTLDALPDTYALALRPHLAEGVGASEIARRLGISANAAGVRLHRGLKLLRRALPAGIAAAAGAGAAGARASVVRARVLDAAREHALLASGAPPAALLAGALATKVALGLAAASVLLLVGWWASRPAVATAEQKAQAVPARSHAPSNAIASASPALEPVAGTPTDVATTRVAPERAHAAAPWQYRLRVVDEATSAPLAHARVGEWTDDGLRTLATTDAHGEARFTAPADANERLYVDADGYAPYRTPRAKAARERLWRQHCVSVGPDGASVVYADLRLTRGAIVEGHVLDERGGPLAGATLYLFDERFQYPRGVTDETLAISARDGWFRLSDPVAWTRDETASNYVLVALTEDGLGFVRFAALSGKERIDDLELVVRPCASFEVLVHTPDGAPLAGVHVRCAPRFGPWERQRELFHELVGTDPAPERYRARFEQWTDADGRARFASLPTVPATSTSVRIGDDWKPLLLFELQFRAPGFEIEPLTHALPGAGVANVVARPCAEVRVRGRVLDADGEPVGGATVSASELPGVESDALGRFELAPLALERFPLTLQASARACAPVRVELAPGAEGWNVVELRMGRALGIAGRVVDERGQPLDGVRVSGAQDESQLVGVWTAADGRFALEDAGSGEWALRVHDKRWNVLHEASAPGGARDVELVVAMQARPTGRLSVRVIDAETGRAADALDATLRALDPRARAAIPARVERTSGSVLASEIGDGWWSLTVRGADERQGELVVELGPDARELELELALHPRADVRGRVDFDGLTAPKGAQVALSRDLERLAGRALPALESPPRVLLWVQPDGTFTVGQLEPGPWIAELRGEHVASAPVRFDPRELGDRELELRARPE